MLGEHVDGFLAGVFHGSLRVLFGDQFYAGEFLRERFLEPFGPVVGGGGVLDEACEDDFAVAVQGGPETARGVGSARDVVRGGEGVVLVGFDAGVDDHDGDAGFLGLFDRADERLGVVRAEHERLDAVRERVFDRLDLLFAVVFLFGAVPADGVAFFLAGLFRAAADDFPPHGGCALRDDGDDVSGLVFAGGHVLDLPDDAGRKQHRRDGEDQDDRDVVLFHGVDKLLFYVFMLLSELKCTGEQVCGSAQPQNYNLFPVKNQADK